MLIGLSDVCGPRVCNIATASITFISIGVACLGSWVRVSIHPTKYDLLSCYWKMLFSASDSSHESFSCSNQESRSPPVDWHEMYICDNYWISLFKDSVFAFVFGAFFTLLKSSKLFFLTVLRSRHCNQLVNRFRISYIADHQCPWHPEQMQQSHH